MLAMFHAFTDWTTRKMNPSSVGVQGSEVEGRQVVVEEGEQELEAVEPFEVEIRSDDHDNDDDDDHNDNDDDDDRFMVPNLHSPGSGSGGLKTRRCR